MTVDEMPAGAHMAKRWLGGRFRLDERICLDDQVSGFPGPCGFSWEARGFSLWKATDQLLSRPVTIYLLPRGPVPRAVTDAVQAAAKVSDPRLATIYDTDFDEQYPYIVTEWTPGTHLEDLVLSGLPHPALAAAMIADAADAIAVAHRAGRPHLRLTPRSMRWDNASGLKITGLGLDAALWGAGAADPVAADAEHRMASPGLAELFEPGNPGMHVTDSVDYVLVLDGAIWLDLDDGKMIRLGPGDTVIQNATRHAWRNLGDSPATLAVVHVGVTR